MTLLDIAPPLVEDEYSIDLLDGIRGYIAGYAGGPAIARELIQNADDAKATWLEFIFTPERLTVRNDSVFTDKDFKAISKIASGSKRTESDSTGTWGTGFVAVYQITDRPEIYSAGQSRQLDPSSHKTNPGLSEVKNETIFHFPWRTTDTYTAERIGAKSWSPTRITTMRDEVADRLAETLPFLRHLMHITIYEENGTRRKLYEVERRNLDYANVSGDTRFERWRMLCWDSRAGTTKPTEETWHFYRGKLASGFYTDGKEIKKPDIAFGFPVRDVPAVGLLYNFLPTEIKTGLPFHINGDFFPDSNRKAVLSRTAHSDESAWNDTVVQGIARLFADNLDHIRIKSNDKARSFYPRLPINTTQSDVQSIVAAFIEKAHTTAIIKTTDGAWTIPSSVRWTADAPLRTLTQNDMRGIAPSDMPDSILGLVQRLEGRELHFADFLDLLNERIKDGTPLKTAPSLMDSREKLYRVFHYIEGLRAEDRDIALQLIREKAVPLCLDRDERLRAFDKPGLWFADTYTRAILPDRALLLVDKAFQEKYEALLKKMLPVFGAAEMVTYLSEIAPQCVGRLIGHALPCITGREVISRICTYLNKREVFTLGLSLKSLPLVVDAENRVQAIDSEVYLADSDTRNLCATGSDVLFVAAEMDKDMVIGPFLERAGVLRLSPTHLLRHLARYCPKRTPIDRAHPFVNNIDKIHRLLFYFVAHRASLTQSDITVLRAIPFVLTQRGDLAAIADPMMPLSLPPTIPKHNVDGMNDILQLDMLVNGVLLGETFRTFLTETLGARELTLVDYIAEYIAPRYSAQNNDAKLRLLELIRDSLPALLQQPGQRALSHLRTLPLIHCVDEEYRPANSVYFASETLDAIFSHDYTQPHLLTYEIEELAYGQKPGPGLSPWYSLFAELGMKTTAMAFDLVKTVRETVTHFLPVKNAIDRIRPIYNLLNEHWLDFVGDATTLKELKGLRWLPADGETGRWYAPNELYSSTLRDLIESQVRILPFRQPNKEPGDFFGIRLSVQTEDVVKHLLWLSQQEDVKVSERIYTYLNQQANHPSLQKLVGQSVIYDGTHNKFWRAIDVFTEDCRSDFGQYRCYAPDFAHFTALMQVLKVRTRPETHDYVRFLGEICRLYPEKALGGDDRDRVRRTYNRLGSLLTEGREMPNWIADLQVMPTALDREYRFTLPGTLLVADRNDLEEKFASGSLHFAAEVIGNQRALYTALGVQALSDVVTRHLINDPSRHSANTEETRLRMLVPAWRRLIEHFKIAQPFGWVDPQVFETIRVYFSDRLDIQYRVRLGNTVINGEITAQPAFYDGIEHCLYLHEAGDKAAIYKQLAREVATILNPAHDNLVPLRTLRELLIQPTSATTILDEDDINRLPAEAEAQEPSSSIVEVAISRIGVTPLLSAVENNTSQKDNLEKGAESEGFHPKDSNESRVRVRPSDITRAAPPQQERLPLEVPAALIPSEPLVGAHTSLDKQHRVMKESNLNPPFAGITHPLVPIQPTDYAGLRRRFGGSIDVSGFEQKEQAAAQRLQVSSSIWDDGDDIVLSRDRRVDQVRFVLSFTMRQEGFLPLTNGAQVLMAGYHRVTCVTEYNDSFPLYLDWERKIAYSDALPAFFMAHLIPAGGVVYLMRQYADTFRLYFVAHVRCQLDRGAHGVAGNVTLTGKLPHE